MSRYDYLSVRAADKLLRSVDAANTTASMTIRDDINGWLDQAEARGMASYGKKLEESDDGRDWTCELIEELIDALYYAGKEIRDLREHLRTPFG